MPTAPAQYILIPGSNGQPDYAALAYKDANGGLATVTTPWYINSSGLLVPAPTDAQGNPQVSPTGSKPAQTVNNDDIAYDVTSQIKFAMLPDYDSAVVQIANNTNETLDVYWQVGVTEYGLGTDVFESSSGNWVGFNAMSVAPGNTTVFVNLPRGPLITLTPQFSTAPSQGTYSIDTYLWMQSH
ncbi:hypothetical protein [Alicyclobacillus sp. ALC3]|uniref:hypothetical protein n=1 Tax=Alicyclobacillus sp. ALC3 TaxID=2796143 RepID=UPI002379EDCE|nr:hypothetical protein [Alicyclobacillus sp. ALC3]WDL96951.1 hypothetical protein JC200_22175 [Alicyclobacillus sp. ALC3]